MFSSKRILPTSKKELAMEGVDRRAWQGPKAYRLVLVEIISGGVPADRTGRRISVNAVRFGKK
jgi:hypothetical protein